MKYEKYSRLIMDLRKTADMARARSTDPFVADLCSMKMKEAAREFEHLLKYVKKLEEEQG